MSGVSLLHGEPAGPLETPGALAFVTSLYARVHRELAAVLRQRVEDRAFVDSATQVIAEANASALCPPSSATYRTVIGCRYVTN